MTVTILATIDRSELQTYREFAGMHEGVQVQEPPDALSPREVRDFYISYWAFIEGLLERHDIEGDEAEEAKISVFTGQIYTGSEQ